MASTALAQIDKIDFLTSRLLEAALTTTNSVFLAHIIGAQCAGHSCLPTHLGLSKQDYEQLVQAHFDNCFCDIVADHAATAAERGTLRQSLLEMRLDEWSEVRSLLLGEKSDPNAVELALASIIAAGCLGSGHLWRDLGMASRTMLRDLLQHNFPQLVQRNSRDMRWKKFFYKALCDHNGGHVCRSPSCDLCVNFNDCFGPET